MDNTIWKPIPQLEGYMASNHGEIKKPHGTLARIRDIRNSTKQIYHVVDMTKDGVSHTYMVARLVAAAFFGLDLTSNRIVEHLNGNKADDYSENLRIADTHRYCIMRGKTAHNKHIFLYDLKGNIVREYENQRRFMADWGISNPGTVNDYLKGWKEGKKIVRFRSKYYLSYEGDLDVSKL